MNAPIAPFIARVSLALQECAFAPEPAGNGDWILSSSNGGGPAIAARMADDWLCLRAAPGWLGRPRAGSAWALLESNADLPGGAKLVLAPGATDVALQAEIPVHDDVGLVGRVRQACAGFARGAAIWRDGESGERDIRAAQGEGLAAAVDLLALSQAAQWNGVARADGVVAVDLKVRGLTPHALLRQGPCGHIAASVDLNGDSVDDEGPPPDCREALARLLLRTNGILRMARATVAGGTPRLEVVFDDAPSPAELGHALAALAVGCELAAREAEVLARDDAAARVYLERTLGPPHPAR